MELTGPDGQKNSIGTGIMPKKHICFCSECRFLKKLAKNVEILFEMVYYLTREYVETFPRLLADHV